MVNGNFALGYGAEEIIPKCMYFDVCYRCYNERGSRTKYVCSSI